MRVAVDVGDVGEGLEDLVELPPVSHPEVPGRVVLVEGVVAEDDDRVALRPVGQRLLQPLHLVAPDPRPGPGDGAVEGRHVAHPLLGRHLLGRPVVGPAGHGVEPDEPDTLVVERPVGLAEERGPLLTHVEVPVVLPRDEVLLDLHFLEQVRAEVELDRIAELGQVPAVDHEVGRRAHRLDFLEGPLGLLDEPGVDVLRVEVVVRDPGEPEGRLLAVREVERVDQGEPAVGRRTRRAGEHRPVDERPPGDLDRGGGPLVRLVQRGMHLAAGPGQVGGSPHLPPPGRHGPGSQPVDLIMEFHWRRLLSEPRPKWGRVLAPTSSSAPPERTPPPWPSRSPGLRPAP